MEKFADAMERRENEILVWLVQCWDCSEVQRLAVRAFGEAKCERCGGQVELIYMEDESGTIRIC